MNYSDLAPAYIRAIAPYQPGKPIAELERELGISGIVKLASNENPLGASPLAVTAMHAAIDDIARYPDGNGFELKDALSKRYQVQHAHIVLGNGSNDLLELAARAFLSSIDVRSGEEREPPLLVDDDREVLVRNQVLAAVQPSDERE